MNDEKFQIRIIKKTTPQGIIITWYLIVEIKTDKEVCRTTSASNTKWIINALEHYGY